MSVETTIARVRSGRGRPFTCQRCGRRGVVLEPVSLGAAMGRLPAACETCNPQCQTWVRERQERPLREAILALDARPAPVPDPTPVEPPRGRARRFGPPGREAVARAVREVTNAAGAAGTREALLDLAAAAQAWAWLLGSRDDR
jgi:hypothetical protein